MAFVITFGFQADENSAYTSFCLSKTRYGPWPSRNAGALRCCYERLARRRGFLVEAFRNYARKSVQRLGPGGPYAEAFQNGGGLRRRVTVTARVILEQRGPLARGRGIEAGA